MPWRKVKKTGVYSAVLRSPITAFKSGKKRLPPKKSGIRCPACGDLIFSLYRHDYRTCACGRTFVDGGDDYMRCGTATELCDSMRAFDVPRKKAEKLMATQPGKRKPMKGPKGWQYVWWPERWWRLWPENLGPWPHDPTGTEVVAGTGRIYHGCVYAARWSFGPLEVRRWSS